MSVLIGILIGIGISVLVYNSKAREKLKTKAQQAVDEIKKVKEKI